MPYRREVKITGPADFTWNSVGTVTSDTVKDGLRTTVWESDQPVNFFNIVGGRWAVRRGAGTAVYYHPAHAYNVAEMVEALDAARKYYSDWFRPYPWRELKLSEFPALASYAQGFPTDITFSESIGFLTESDPKANAAFMVTAHEAAHQWWGNMVAPGKGPGGNLLSEGTAHFSTLLLFEQVKGLHARIEFAKKIEDSYAKGRQADSERPLVKTDGSRDGDQTVTYDKTGWVLWMLLNQMGRDRMLAGHPGLLRDLPRQPRPPRAPGLPRRAPPLRGRPRGVRRLHPPVVLPGGRSRVPPDRAGEGQGRNRLEGHRPPGERRDRPDARRGRGGQRRALQARRLAPIRLTARPGPP